MWTCRSGAVQQSLIHMRAEAAFTVGKLMMHPSINKQPSQREGHMSRAEKQEQAGSGESPVVMKGDCFLESRQNPIESL